MKITTRQKDIAGTATKILIGLFYALPVIICIIFSIQSNKEINTVPNHLIPENPTWNNYRYVFDNVPVFTYMKNTLIMILIEVPVQLIISATSAYAFAFYKFKGKSFLFALFLTTMMIPGETTLVANFMTVRSLGLMNTYLGLTIVSFANASGIFILRQNMMTLPGELWEAAHLDGCGKMRYFTRIVLPLCRSLLSCQAVVSFIGTFNSYLWPLMISSTDEFYTIQVGMSVLPSGDMGYALAGAVICMIIPLLIYVFLQRQVVSGMTAGAIKS